MYHVVNQINFCSTPNFSCNILYCKFLLYCTVGKREVRKAIIHRYTAASVTVSWQLWGGILFPSLRIAPAISSLWVVILCHVFGQIQLPFFSITAHTTLVFIALYFLGPTSWKDSVQKVNWCRINLITVHKLRGQQNEDTLWWQHC